MAAPYPSAATHRDADRGKAPSRLWEKSLWSAKRPSQTPSLSTSIAVRPGGGAARETRHDMHRVHLRRKDHRVRNPPRRIREEYRLRSGDYHSTKSKECLGPSNAIECCPDRRLEGVGNPCEGFGKTGARRTSRVILYGDIRLADGDVLLAPDHQRQLR
jgi:hypothetical protein